MQPESDILLADAATISSIAINAPDDKQAKALQRNAAGRTKRRSCTCGKCRTCIDNARWEAVFRQKFADPLYYTPRRPTQGSSLNGF
jgi:hypothetical protein